MNEILQAQLRLSEGADYKVKVVRQDTKYLMTSYDDILKCSVCQNCTKKTYYDNTCKIKHKDPLSPDPEQQVPGARLSSIGDCEICSKKDFRFRFGGRGG